MSVLIGFPAKYVNSFTERFTVVRNVNPEVDTFYDVFALPEYDALFAKDGTRINISKRVNLPRGIQVPKEVVDRVAKSDNLYEPPQIRPPQIFETIEYPVHFFGAIWPHYGHFLTDGMGRMWDIDASSNPLLILNRADKNYLNNAFISKIFQYSNIQKLRLFNVEQPTLFKEVRIPASSIEHCYRIFDCHQNVHCSIANEILRGSAYENFEKVYLSRSALSDQLRLSRDETLLEEILSKQGFKIVHPEKLSLETQVKIFNQSRWIVGTVGSAFHTSLFSTKLFKGELAILSWEKINQRYPMIDAIKENETYYINCITLETIDHRQRIQTTSINVEYALRALASIGAVSPIS